MESNAFYYRRRAVEERMAAQRSITEQARASACGDSTSNGVAATA
jgi:hypothetical protein